MAFQNRIPVIGGFFDNPEQEALTQRFNDMANAYGQYRGVHADARQQGLGAQLGMFGPMQEYLSLMMPGISPFDIQGAQAQFGNTVAALKQNQNAGVTDGQGPAGFQGLIKELSDPNRQTDPRPGSSFNPGRRFFGI